MIAAIGGINTMWVTAGAFGVVHPRDQRAAAGWRRQRRPVLLRPDGPWSGCVEGLRFVWNLRVLRTLALIDLAMTALYLPMESVLFPKYFTDRHEPAHLGWVLVALSVGGLAGALGLAVLVAPPEQAVDAADGHADSGRVHRADIDASAAVAGDPAAVRADRLVYGPIAPIYNYVMQTKSPPQLRGRVVGVMTSLAYAAGPTGLHAGRPADRRHRASDDVSGTGDSDDRHRPGVASTFLASGVGRVVRARVAGPP